MNDSKERGQMNGIARNIGVGALPPTGTATEDLFQCGFTQIPVIEYVTWTINMPVNDLDIDKTFGAKINVLASPDQVPGVESVDSSFVVNAILQTDMLVAGFGVHIFGEPLAFSTIGNAMTPAPAAGSAPIWSPDVFTEKDRLNGALGVADAAVTPADLQWGNVCWEAAWHLANGYTFDWRVQQRYYVIKELAADVCYFGPYADAVAASSSEEALQPFVRRVNDRYDELAAGGNFVPVNNRRIGSITVSGATGAGVFHATRDYDTVGTTFGGIRNQGATGCCQPFRKLQKPVLLDKGCPIGMSLQVQDEFHQTEFQKLLSLTGRQGGNLETLAMAANIGGLTLAGNNFTGAELSLDAGGATITNQRVQTNRVIFKGGTMKIAILIKGVELWGPWKEYVTRTYSNQYMTPNAVSGPAQLAPMGR